MYNSDIESLIKEAKTRWVSTNVSLLNLKGADQKTKRDLRKINGLEAWKIKAVENGKIKNIKRKIWDAEKVALGNKKIVLGKETEVKTEIK